MEKFKPEFGNKEHIDLIKQEAAKQALVEIYEEYGDYVCSYDRFLKLQDQISKIADTLNEVYVEIQCDDDKIKVLKKFNGAIDALLELEDFDPYE
jgi:hypothetical protein